MASRKSRRTARRVEAIVALSKASTAAETLKAATVALKVGVQFAAIINAASSAGYRRGYVACIQDKGGE